MTEKVKLTQVQAEAIEKESYRDYENILYDYLVVSDYDEKFKGLTFGGLYRALHHGYEVEEEFKVGDWMINTTNDKAYELGKMMCLKINANPGLYKHLRHATPEEIAEEKQRRWWAKHGRNVFEFKKGDLIVHGKIVTGVTEVKGDLLWVEMNASVGTITKENYDQIKVIYFAEDLKYLGESK